MIFWSPALALAILLLSFGGGIALYEHRRQPGLLLLILLSSINATLGSGVNIRYYYAPTPCDAGVIASGFPFPWHYTWYSYLIYARIPDCPYYFQTAVFGITLFFLFDTLFYGAIILAILELYRALKRGTKSSSVTPPSSVTPTIFNIIPTSARWSALLQL